MNKLFAIIKREYVERVRSKMFIVATVLGPLLMVGLTVGPAMLFGMKTGDATRLAVVDQTGTLYDRVRESISNPKGRQPAEEESAVGRMNAERPKPLAPSFNVEQVSNVTDVSRLDEIKNTLTQRVKDKNLDAFVILPSDVLTGGEVTYYGRNTGDLITIEQVEDRINDALIEQRFVNAGLDPSRIASYTTPIEMNTINALDSRQDSGGGFILAYGVGFLIYFLVIIYGGIVLSAVVEEKTTRIAEVLFSSASAFTLLLGKLLGVSLVALTQLVIWGTALVGLSLYGASSSGGVLNFLPTLAPSLLIYLVLYFILGFFIYATLYALVGAMVTTTQEGQQLATPIVLILVAAFVCAPLVIRNPNSQLAFWISMVPLLSPIAMLIRIVTEKPPFWQIALSLIIGYASIVALVWVAARVYRTGMLMYGKRATIPEVLKWMRQS